MYDILFYFGQEIVIVRVNGKRIYFSYTGQEGTFSPMEKLKLNRDGVLKEYPDLINDEEWEKEAVKRFEKHLHTMPSELDIVEYVKKDLKKFGYIPKTQKRNGFRPVNLSEE